MTESSALQNAKMEHSPIEVAIVGGGLSGLVLANALSRHEHLSVNVYEADTEFKERGASVGLIDNAQNALRMLGLHHLLAEAGAVPTLGCRNIIVGLQPCCLC